MGAFLSFNGRRKHYFIAFIIQVALAAFFVYNWDRFVLLTSVKEFLEGITPYKTAQIAPPYIFHTWTLVG
jgi:hypothetical protein